MKSEKYLSGTVVGLLEFKQCWYISSPNFFFLRAGQIRSPFITTHQPATRSPSKQVPFSRQSSQVHCLYFLLLRLPMMKQWPRFWAKKWLSRNEKQQPSRQSKDSPLPNCGSKNKSSVSFKAPRVEVTGIQWEFVPKAQPLPNKSYWSFTYHNRNTAALFLITDLLAEKWPTNHLKGFFLHTISSILYTLTCVLFYLI